MLISVVSGTYNRLQSLMRMMQSARDCLASSLEYEFVIVDGGSTDGTPQFLSTQPDTRVIQHGDLKGAIRAFTDGAVAAEGKYVILANDDITFAPGSIMAALEHLESHPFCGAVAFMDNRPTPQKMQGTYAAQTMTAIDPQGNAVRVVYAQVGMFRRDLGDKAGWWGADDPVMNKSRTYGGDNYLSSRLWEAGYTVDVVKEALCDDHIVQDALRFKNVAANDRAYYERYPDGAKIKLHNATALYHEQLRILYLPVFEAGSVVQRQNKKGLRQALQKRSIVWEWDYIDSKPAIAENLKTFAPHLIITQFMDSQRGVLIDQLRALCPQAWIVNWNGDARHLTDRDYLDMLRKVDMQLVTNASALEIYARAGIPAAYWQIGYEPRSVHVKKSPVAPNVVFMGTCYSAQRRELEYILKDFNTAFFGLGWKDSSGDSLYDFDLGDAIYRSARIAISDCFDDGKTETLGFVSNRFFEALASGVFLLQQHVPGLDAYNGTRAGEHYIEWQDLEELPKLILKWLKASARSRRNIAQAGQKFILENYSFDRQVDKLFNEILPMLEVAQEKSVL